MFRCNEFISHNCTSKLDCMRELTNELNQLGSNVSIVDIQKEFRECYGIFTLKTIIIYEE